MVLKLQTGRQVLIEIELLDEKGLISLSVESSLKKKNSIGKFSVSGKVHNFDYHSFNTVSNYNLGVGLDSK